MICMEGFFYSRKGMMMLERCKHFLHYKCYLNYLEHSINCPICGISMANEEKNQILKEVNVERDQMVEMSKEFFKDQPFVDIWCHNC